MIKEGLRIRMHNNIFLTGNIHVGKTTLINKILKGLSINDIKGFRTSRYYKKNHLEGFYLESVLDDGININDVFIGKCINKNSWVSIPFTFDEYGVQIIQNCMDEPPDLMVMDELGFFENEAFEFQQKVREVLDSQIPVFGVLKQKETIFLNELRSRKDVEVYTITAENRASIYPIIIEKIEMAMDNNQPKSISNMGAQQYDEVSNEVFSPIYEIIAKQIKDKTQINSGICLDIGTGAGSLGIELAKITNLKMHLLDKSQDMLDIAEKNIVHSGMGNQLQTVLGDVHELPYRNDSIDLVISRGSLYFWEDQRKAFKEILRVLAPGGIAYVGGGFGTIEMKKKIDVKMQEIDKHWRRNVTKKIEKTNINYKKLLKSIQISNFQMIKDEANMWIVISKESNENIVTA